MLALLGKSSEDSEPAPQHDLPRCHTLSAADALERLRSSRLGLSVDEARRRQERYGPNQLPERKPPSLLLIFLRQFKDPLIYILLIAAVISLLTGYINNFSFISAVLLFNAGIGTFQERKAETSAQALQHVVSITAQVSRGGDTQSVDAAELVPGDVVAVEAGAAVPADLRLLDARDLRVDESLLTGESEPVEKWADAVVDADSPVGDRRNMAHAGSSVLRGRARGVVCRTGVATEVGAIAKSLAQKEAELPPLVIRLRKLTRTIAYFVLGAVAVLATVQLLRSADLIDIFFLTVALAVSAIPAGLPAAITVALSIASSRMAKRNVIVRLLPAVEGLGACTLIASDKTGTLTANILTLKRVSLPDGTQVDVTGEGYDMAGAPVQNGEAVAEPVRAAVAEMAIAGVLCNEARARRKNGETSFDGDPVDVAFLVFGAKLGSGQDVLREGYRRVGEIPFESEQRFAATFDARDNETWAHVKGATEKLLPMCSGVDSDAVKQAEGELAAEGYRVLAVARGRVEPDKARQSDPGALQDLHFLGLVGLIDPIRPQVPEAVSRCGDAGIDVRMITGDHPATGLAIARELGMADAQSRAVTGHALKGDSPRAIADAKVFARIEPTQKTRIVQTLQKWGHFVAVTGDGANDAPALRGANIGVAMGRSGTDVARGAADLILTDDNFASIVAGVEEGRIAYDNVRKVTWLLLATGAGEVLLFFLAIGAGLPIPLLPVQLLWLNLVTNGIQDVALAFEKGESGVLKRKPRAPDERVFNRRMIEEVALSGAYIALFAFATYWYALNHLSLTVQEARNLTLLLVVLFENVHAFSCRSERLSAFRLPLRNNVLLVIAVGVAQGVHIGAMYTPGLSTALQLVPVSAQTWFTLLPIALTLLLFDELVKLIRHRIERRHSHGQGR